MRLCGSWKHERTRIHAREGLIRRGRPPGQQPQGRGRLPTGRGGCVPAGVGSAPSPGSHFPGSKRVICSGRGHPAGWCHWDGRGLTGAGGSESLEKVPDYPEREHGRQRGIPRYGRVACRSGVSGGAQVFPGDGGKNALRPVRVGMIATQMRRNNGVGAPGVSAEHADGNEGR